MQQGTQSRRASPPSDRRLTMADDSSSPLLQQPVPPPAATAAPTLDSLPVDVLNRVIVSLLGESEEPGAWYKIAGRLACVNRSLRKSTSSLAVWKDEVRVIGRANEVSEEGRCFFSVRRSCTLPLPGLVRGRRRGTHHFLAAPVLMGT